MRQATIADLPAMHAIACEFYAASQSLGAFDLGDFTALWTDLLSSGSGVIFIHGDDEIDGVLGGVVHQDVNNRKVTVASEFFWYVKKQSRGGVAGMRLYFAFEKWARRRGCERIEMVHLHDLMPAEIASIYRRLGYKPVETRYTKELS